MKLYIKAALANLFDASVADNILPDNWISCDDPDFSSTFKLAAARCQKYIYSFQEKKSTELSDYSRPKHFACCFAIVDLETNSALISDSPDGLLFASPSYEAYRADTKKIAKELGKSSPTELSFKTLYSDYTCDDNTKTPGSFKYRIAQARTIAKQLRSRHPKTISVTNHNGDCRLFLTGRNREFEFTIHVKSDIPELDLRKIGSDYFELNLPQDFKCDEDNLKMLYNLMVNANKYAHS